MKTSVLGAALLLAVAVTPLEAQESYTVSGSRVAIYNLAGQVTVEPGSGSGVQVMVTTGGGDRARLKVETGSIGDRETLRVIYPDDRIVYNARRCEGRSDMYVRDDGTFGNGWDRGRGHRVTVACSGSGTEAWADLRIRVPAGQRVSINLGVGRIEASNLNGDIDLDTASGDITARSVRGSLSLDTGSGDAEASDIDGDLSIDTGSGDVRVTGMKNGELSIDTGSGSVTASAIDATEVSVDTGSGDVNLDGVSARSISLDTGSGEITVGLRSVAVDLNADTGSGDVTLFVPDGFGAEVRIETSSGDIDTEVPIQLRRKDRDELSGRIGDGRGRVEIETGSGDVRIRKK